MSTDNSSAFASDVSDANDRRAELERELAEMDGTESDVAVIESDDTSNIPDDEEEGEGIQPVVKHLDLLDGDITILPPTDVEVTFWQQDMGSSILSDDQRLGAYGDFCMSHVQTTDYRRWRNAVTQKARKTPSRGGAIFGEELEKLTELILEQTVETDQQVVVETKNRHARRAALREKNARNDKRKG